MKKRSKMPSRILALLMAALMAVTSAPITAFAADSSESMFQSTSTIIDDPVSGTTGSGWDNIDGGSSTTPPDEGEGDNESSSKPEDGNESGNSSTPGDGEDNNSSSTPEDGNGNGNTSSTPEGGDEDNSSSSVPEEEENDNTSPAPDGGEENGSSSIPEDNGSVDADDLNGTDNTQPVVPPADGVINGTELPWAANFAAYAEATMGMPAPYIAGDAGGGKVTFTHYGWGVPGGGGTKH